MQTHNLTVVSVNICSRGPTDELIEPAQSQLFCLFAQLDVKNTVSKSFKKSLIMVKSLKKGNIQRVVIDKLKARHKGL